MKIQKYKITSPKYPGYVFVTYVDGHFNAVLNAFNPPLSEKALNYLLNRIPDAPEHLTPMMLQGSGGKITVEEVKAIREEPVKEECPPNEKIAIFCFLYEASLGLKYKTSAADAGKMKALTITAEELKHILEVYFASTQWNLKDKSIANFIKHYNEVRVLAYAKPAPIKFPLPFDSLFFTKLSTNDQRAYHQFLRDNGYVFQHSGHRGGSWVKKVASI